VTSVVKVDVVWDGIRAYRVPKPGEIEAVRLMSLGHSSREASQMMGLRSIDTAHRRVNEAQAKLHGCSHGDTVYRMYRLGLLDNPYDPQMTPVLNQEQRYLLDVVDRMSLPYRHAHVMLGIGRSTLIRRMNEIHELLGADTRMQAISCAVKFGDMKVDAPAQLWRGRV